MRLPFLIFSFIIVMSLQKALSFSIQCVTYIREYLCVKA